MANLSTQQAQQELFGAYSVWKTGYKHKSNAPRGCSVISAQTANTLKRQWILESTNSWSQTMQTGKKVSGDIIRWVSGSISGQSGTVDFHAFWRPQKVRFVWHFRVG